MPYQEGCFRPTFAYQLLPGDLLILEEEVDWTELLVVGVRVEEEEILLVLMEEDGILRSWGGPSESRHFTLRKQGQTARQKRDVHA